jgi:hypothetical protein
MHAVQLLAPPPASSVLPRRDTLTLLLLVPQVGSSGDNPESAGLAIPVQIAPLNFSIDQYIAIGSPLGLFLALRKVRLHAHCSRLKHALASLCRPWPWPSLHAHTR